MESQNTQDDVFSTEIMVSNQGGYRISQKQIREMSEISYICEILLKFRYREIFFKLHNSYFLK
jgi:hypothetical protein